MNKNKNKKAPKPLSIRELAAVVGGTISRRPPPGSYPVDPVPPPLPTI